MPGVDHMLQGALDQYLLLIALRQLCRQGFLYGHTLALSAPPKPFKRLLCKFIRCHLDVACERNFEHIPEVVL